MRTYEALYIVRPDEADDQIQTIAQAVETLVTEDGGAIVRSEIWGKRRLAYEVKKFTEGVYILLRFTAEPTLIPRLEQYFRLTEAVIRHLVVHFDEKTLRLEAEQQRRKEEEIRASVEEARRREQRAAQRAAREQEAQEAEDVAAPEAAVIAAADEVATADEVEPEV